jgi:hypothetical protein
MAPDKAVLRDILNFVKANVDARKNNPNFEFEDFKSKVPNNYRTLCLSLIIHCSGLCCKSPNTGLCL